ncbi:hypothetical protein B9Z65_3904 [Elsinoe australis]|uniref:Uncharacterized protein n=1 Tax=Elsinoe australis TaxID=40998 RepID=A0A2P8A2Z6_9PEZI|nr:hypothetical protein B9Z65_3904 [Elsinoe australis]
MATAAAAQLTLSTATSSRTQTIANIATETISQADDDDPFGTSTPIGISSQQQSNLRNFTGRATPPVPPGLEGLGQVPPGQPESQSEPPAGNRSEIRPAVPASLSKHALTQGKTSASRKSSMVSATSRPVTPLSKAPVAEQKKPAVQEEFAKVVTEEEKLVDTAKAVAASTVPSVATPKKPAVVDPSKSAETPVSEKAQPKPDAKNTPTAKLPPGPQATPVATPIKWGPTAAPAEKPKAAQTSAQDSTQTTADGSKRKHPGKIDITAAVNQPAEASRPALIETPVKSQRSGTPSVPSRPVSPGSNADASTKRRAHTIRLVTTPQVEKAPVLMTPLAAAVAKIPSRNPSIASANPPGTPSSEHISDSMSLASTSISRPASPPPGGRVGSAPVRTKTKNQVKKERQERAKAIEEEKKLALETDEQAADSTVQEAITSRKKKAKKPAAAPKPKPKQEPSRPASPAEKQPEPEAQSTPPIPVAKESPKPEKQDKSAPAVPQEDGSPAELITEMRSTFDFLSKAFDVFFRPLAQTNNHYKPSQPITSADLDLDRPFERNPDAPLYPDELKRMLKNSELFRYGGNDNRIWSQGCVTPHGAHLRYLEAELEERYGLLERDVRALPPQMVFHADKTRRYNGVNVHEELPSVDLEAMRRDLESGGVRTREANAMEKAVEEGSKKGSFLVGNAEQYINEFVMPVVRDGRAQEREGRDGEEQAGKKMGLEELEKALVQARKAAEEKEAALRKVIKKNRKMMGFAH